MAFTDACTEPAPVVNAALVESALKSNAMVPAAALPTPTSANAVAIATTAVFLVRSVTKPPASRGSAIGVPQRRERVRESFSRIDYARRRSRGLSSDCRMLTRAERDFSALVNPYAMVQSERRIFRRDSIRDARRGEIC